MKKFKKLTAGLLGAVMALSVCSFTAFAEGKVVARIGDEECGSVTEALEKVTEETETTIELIADTEEDITIPAGKNIVLDLNDNDITNISSHTITNNGTLRIEGSGTVDNVTHGKAAIWNNGTIILDGGNYTRSNENGSSAEDSGGNSYYTLLNHGNMTINDGVRVSQGPNGKGQFSSLVENGWYDGTKKDIEEIPVMIINGGVFNGGLNTIKNDDWGELIINNGTFKNTTQAAFLNWNVAKVNGGKFESEGAAILVGSLDNVMDKGELTINGGTFESEKESIAQMTDKKGEIKCKNTVIKINGGIFKSEVEEVFDEKLKGQEEKGNLSLNIVSGSFTSDVSDYMDDESKLVKDEDGNYVAMNKDAIKESTTKFYIDNYDDLKTAIANQTDGVTWILNDNIDVTGMIFINTDVTIEGNDKTLTFTGSIFGAGGGQNSFIQVEDGADVTIRDLTIDGDSGVEGSEKVKHGINIFSYEADDQITKVTVDNVKIVDCGGYAITNNASEVVVESLETSGNLWGGINVDNSKKTAGTRKEGAKLTIKDAVINEDNSVYFENENYEAGTKVDAEIKDGEFAGTVAIGDPGATLEITGGDFEGAVGTVAGSDINIVSGTFATDIRDYIDDGSEFIKDKDGNYVVMDEIDSKRPSHSYSLEEGRVDRDDEDKEEPVVTTEPEEEAGPFSDVGKDNPNYDAIIKVYENGWMAGIGDGVFAPNGTLTRGMGAMVLWNKAGCPEPQNVAPFLDVTSDDWYAKAVAWAYEQGIVAGYGDVFGPDDALTTEQFERMSAIANGKTPEIYVGGAPNATRGWVASLLAM